MLKKNYYEVHSVDHNDDVLILQTENNVITMKMIMIIIMIIMMLGQSVEIEL